jgi:outer membrane receptor protein involved in Fe transport
VRLQGLGLAADIAGKEMVAAPNTLASVRLSRESEHWGSWALEWSHLGRYYFEPTVTYNYPGHDLFNLRWDRPLSPHLHLAVRLLNVTNRDYAERADYAFGNYRYFVGEPRSAYIKLRWEFSSGCTSTPRSSRDCS